MLRITVVEGKVCGGFVSRGLTVRINHPDLDIKIDIKLDTSGEI